MVRLYVCSLQSPVRQWFQKSYNFVDYLTFTYFKIGVVFFQLFVYYVEVEVKNYFSDPFSFLIMILNCVFVRILDIILQAARALFRFLFRYFFSHCTNLDIFYRPSKVYYQSL